MQDRLELLLFSLGTAQRFGINVLKVQEIIPCPKLTHLPESHPAVRGVTHLRGNPVTVIDLSQAIGRAPLCTDGDCSGGSVIVAEVNRSREGFLVDKVDRIVVCDWANVLPPPSGTGATSYITGVTRVNDALVQVLDVERIIGEVTASAIEHGPIELDPYVLERLQGKRVLVVDDSSVARHQTANTLEPLGIDCTTARDGKEALELLLQLHARREPMVDMVISDIEMPEMDGYTLVREIRANPDIADLYVVLHTSLNGAINADKAQQAGADNILTKFVPTELAQIVVETLTAGRSQESEG